MGFHLNEVGVSTRSARVVLLLLMSALLSGCATINQVSQNLSESVSYQDKVTGERTLGLMSEESEISQGAEAQKQIIDDYTKRGLKVDTDPVLLAKLRGMLKSITDVSHRPELPWELHLVETKDQNAFALPGGKVFVLRGIIGGMLKSDDELAGVIAHEVAHIACRHQVKSQAWNMVMPMIQKRARNEVYQASYTTLNEDEADKVGLFYMAMAGRDPQAMVNVWKRADQEMGSHPGNFLYDHSLNATRASKVGALAPVAAKYYAGPGVRYADYKNALEKNDMIARGGFGGDSGLLNILELGLNTYGQYKATKTEQVQRETEQARLAQNLSYARLENVRRADTADGRQSLSSNLTNTSDRTMKSAVVTVSYLDSQNKVLYSENARLSNIAAGRSATCGVYLKNVENAKNVRMDVTYVEF